MEKAEIQKLIQNKSERIVLVKNDGTSDVWNAFNIINIDKSVSNFVMCLRCHTPLKWKSHDGTSGLRAHSKTCITGSNAKSQKLTDMPAFFTNARALVQERVVSATDKSHLTDVIVNMCATDIR